ncbi:MAG: SagB/ThcOx family dehydrogenase [Proteobacteria bacterium]|nr:SagB/ThcOx family dehydrogenase [Pseudomonadota bacterium]
MSLASDVGALPDAVTRVRAYHQRTKHMPERNAPGPGYMDWANQPDPFRRFSGARNIELPLVPDDGTPPYDALFHSRDTPPRPLTAESLGLFLELSLGITAWKEFQGTRWALRSNPSSGNLHPTEGYVVLPPLASLSDCPGVYHYAPREHALEQRCVLGEAAGSVAAAGLPAGAFLVGLTSVHWREAWKYGERAYRYCQHDAGHALGAVCFAAAALGWRVALLSALSDAEVAGLLGLDRAADFAGAEAEHPDLIAAVVTDPAAAAPRGLDDGTIAALRAGRWAGTANRLSPERVDWAAIGAVEDATVKPHTAPLPLPDLAASSKPAQRPIRDVPRSAAIIRQRRSAVDMDARTGLPLDTFFGMLARTLPDRPHPPWTAIDFPGRIHLCLFVHRIDGLSPGLYVLMRDEARLDAFRAACHDGFAWTRVKSSGMPLYALALGDCREAAAHASCLQAIAGDGAFSLGMVADFARTLEGDGAWAYRRLFWETGLIGQVLYLEAEAAGVRSTGMGCYFDDFVHQLLGMDLADDAWQSLYHFTVGGALEDERLTTLPAYGHLPPDRVSPSRRGRFAL